MQKSIVILLAFTVFAQSINFSWKDYSNLPILAAHISDHLKNGDDLDSFIALHYGSKASDHKEEHEEHEDLPFNPDQVKVTMQVDYFYYEQQIQHTLVENKDIQNNFTYSEISPNLLIDQFFQPPKL